MNRIAKVLSQISDDMLMHYGVARRSGRYPWGSGDNPYQHSGDFLSRVQSLKKSGMSETDIAKTMGLTTTQLRTQPIYDSSGQNICDSSGREIQGRIIFADESEVVSLRQQVSHLDTFIRSVISRLGYVTDHALLDSDYKGL